MAMATTCGQNRWWRQLVKKQYLISADGHLHSVEAWRVVGVSELLPAAGEDLVDGEAAEVVPPQEPVQHVVQHARGAGLANTFTPSLFSL